MKVTVAENTILVNKIVSRVKMERVKDTLSQEVESLKSAQARMVEEKEREGEELRENIEESNAETRARLEEIMRRTGNNIKRMEWESNRRQINMKDKIMTLLGTKKANEGCLYNHIIMIIEFRNCVRLTGPRRENPGTRIFSSRPRSRIFSTSMMRKCLSYMKKYKSWRLS